MELAKYLSGFLYDPRNEILPFPQKKIFVRKQNKIQLYKQYSSFDQPPLRLSPASVSSFSVAILIPTRTDIEPSCGRRTQRPIPAAARCTRAACALSPIADSRNAGGWGGSRYRPPLLRLGSPAHCSAARLNRRFLGYSISKIRLVNYLPASLLSRINFDVWLLIGDLEIQFISIS